MTPPIPQDQLGMPVYIDAAHGVTPDPNADLTRDVAVCSPRDIQRGRLWVNPGGTQLVTTSMFPVNEMTSISDADRGRMLDINQALWRQIVGARGDFLYTVALQSGNYTTRFQSLCREATPVSGSGADARYRLYNADMPELNNLGSSPALQAVPFRFYPGEISTLVNGLPIPNTQYGVDPSDPHTMVVVPDAAFFERIRTFINGANSPIAADRRAAMTEAFQPQHYGTLAAQARTEAFQRHAQEAQEGMRSEMRWTMIAMGALQVLTTAFALGKGAGIVSAVTMLPRAILTPLVEGGINVFTRRPGNYDWRWTRSFFTDVSHRYNTAFRYRHIPTLSNIGTNLTEAGRRGELRPVADATTPQVAQRIENTINSRFNTMSVLVEGPPGWGKEFLMRELARRNPNTVFIQLTPNGMMGGTKYRGELEQRMVDIPREIAAARRAGMPVVLCLDEFHEALSAGKGMEQAVSLLEQWKGEIARGEIRIVGFSTPRELLKARYIAGYFNDPASRARLSPEEAAEVAIFERDGVRQSIELRALLNRFERVSLPSRPETDVSSIVRDMIESRRQSHNLTINMDDAVVRRIIRYSESAIASEGYIPRTTAAIFNGVVDRHIGNSSSVTITEAMLDTYVQEAFPDIHQRINGGTPPPPPVAPRPAGPAVVENVPGAPPPSGTAAVDPATHFTRENFLDMMRARYPRYFNTDGTINSNFGNSIEILAQTALDRWSAEVRTNPAGSMMLVEGRMFPHERFIEGVMTEAGRQLEGHPGAGAFRDALVHGRERLGEGRGIDSLPEATRERGRTFVELVTRR